MVRLSPVLFAAALSTLWSAFPAVRLPQQTPTFKSGARVVPIYATVTDADRRLVPGLTREEFEILDNDRPQTLALFDNEVQPITVVVMLDTSASMTLNIDFVQAGAEQFFLRLMRNDTARVGAFNDKIQFACPFTSSPDELVAALRDLDFGNPTRLYDAIDVSLSELKGIDGRRVVLVFTDGDDTFSKSANLGSVLERARAEDVMIYAIGLESNYFDGMRRVRTRPDRGLRKLAEETGGGYFELQKTDQLTSTFTRVSEELHSQYLLGFVPQALDGKVHKLEVRVRQPGMQARARKSYIASPERPSTGK
jgi:Ca-activated chloride channel family protein